MGVALVTGGAKRIGAEICRALASNGHSVIIHYRNSVEAATELSEELNKVSKSVIIRADLEDSEQAKTLLDKAAKIFGPIDILINNASMFEYDHIDSLNIDLFNRSIATNTLAPILLIQAFAKQSLEAQGCIINLLDQKLENPNQDYLSYTASKTALAGLVEPLAIGLAPAIRVNGIAPGLTLPSPHASVSEFERLHDKTPLGRGATPSDISEAVVFLIGAQSVTGQVLFVDGGERLHPRDTDVLYGRGE
jgi:NAD(P)-dependent dehydrogenase (short-subunit alcohol dehydrogenase family)